MVQSAGIILYRKREGTEDTEFFVCTPKGPEWEHRVCWNFPKGMIQENEHPCHAAVREFEEETGIKLNELAVFGYHGWIRQNPKKEVCVYSKLYDGEDTSNCHSNTFTWTDGNEYPEVGDYRWMTADEIINEGGVKAYYDLFRHIKA